jgi:hypothetical protein
MPEVQELGAALRRALENTRRTAQVYLKAVQDAEEAYVAYEEAMVEQMEDLMRDRAALAEERRIFWSERGQQEHARPTGQDEEDAIAYAEDEDLGVYVGELGMEEAELQGGVQGGGRLHVKPTQGGMVHQNGASRGRNRDRSRSRDRLGKSAGRVEAAIRDLGLDESAARVLRELPIEQSAVMIDQVDGSVRNPSAFIMSLAHRASKGKGKGSAAPGPSPEERVEERSRRLGLDQSASRMIFELQPEHALSILEQVGDDVRNPSAFVTAEVRKVIPGGGAGKSRHDGSGVGGSGAKGTASAPREFAQQIGQLAKQLDLDGSCVDALHNLTPQDAVQILERLASDISTIRNRSAFVLAEVKKRRQSPSTPATARTQGGGGGGGGSGSRTETRSVPCKFFAEGRCKNGSDCRFSHN